MYIQYSLPQVTWYICLEESRAAIVSLKNNWFDIIFTVIFYFSVDYFRVIDESLQSMKAFFTWIYVG